MMTEFRERRSQKILDTVCRVRDVYENTCAPEQIAAWQLERFNALWSDWRIHVPYFVKLAGDRKLTDRFECWEEVQEAFPVVTRHQLQSAGAELHDVRKPADYQRTTGGSTAEPVQLPAWDSERGASAASMWYTRSWFGVRPADPLFLIWGHSHLLGGGVKGRVNQFVRTLRDRALGYTRWSAYDLGDEALRRAGDCLLARKPAWMLGYSVALDRLARVNRDRAPELRRLRLKLVVATAESFPRADSADLIGEVFGCPVAMEYGAVETGVIAHQHPEREGFRVLWQDHIVEIEKGATDAGHADVIVTSLFPRACPIVRYRLGDRVGLLAGVDPRLAFAQVTGRCNDVISLSDGRFIHSEAFAHVVKDCSEVLGFQVHQDRDGVIVFRYIANKTPSADTVVEIRRRLGIIDASLRAIKLRRVDQLEQTVAGKTRAVLCDIRMNSAPVMDNRNNR